MRTLLVAAAAIAIGAGAASAQQGAPAAPAGTWPAPQYVAIPMELVVNKPAKDVWAKVGGYCDISKWIGAAPVPCELKSGTGEVGTVRVIAGRITEVMTAKSELGYGYTQPAVEGKWYNLYHGFLEVRPIDAKSSKLVYTLMVDEADKADQAAKDKDVASRKKQFEGALANMKKLAEG
ncbi:MAG TPA: hypothetical protein VGO52_09425 [Hyphomonadaceae bacterium]|jgi:hypothetical protein|nr:hypothetical protein [Hyphomonadaceae bacterium]